MSRSIMIIAIIAVILCNIALIVFAPDTLSMIIIGCMLLIILLGNWFGLLPMTSFIQGFRVGDQTIRDTLITPADSAWTTLQELEEMFQQKTLDNVFDEYREKIRFQRESEQTLNELDDYINEKTISHRCWQNVIAQIPGTLTGIGVLGTFIGLLMGISKVGFTSADAALESVQSLLSGIHVAFYTSIAGIILSILFNILHRAIWNMLLRELGVFLDIFHKNVIPTVEEQERYKEQLHREYVLERLERIPREMPTSYGGGGGAAHGHSDSMNERILLPQIIQGLKDNEFSFVLSPKHDIHSREILSTEAQVKWNHKKLGSIPPSVFMPIVEENGLITKINRFIWEEVCKTIQSWEQNEVPHVPVAINISKVDLLADKGDISGFFKVMLDRYNIPPRMIDIEIAMDAFVDAKTVTLDSVAAFRAKGFKVILDHFDGNYVPIDAIEELHVDELKLNITGFDVKESCALIEEVYDQAKHRAFVVNCEGVKSLEQVKELRNGGCRVIQGSFFSNPVSPTVFAEQQLNEHMKAL